MKKKFNFSIYERKMKNYVILNFDTLKNPLITFPFP